MDSHKAWGTAKTGTQTSSLPLYVLLQGHSTLDKQQTFKSAVEKIQQWSGLFFSTSQYDQGSSWTKEITLFYKESTQILNVSEILQLWDHQEPLIYRSYNFIYTGWLNNWRIHELQGWHAHCLEWQSLCLNYGKSEPLSLKTWVSLHYFSLWPTSLWYFLPSSHHIFVNPLPYPNYVKSPL